jgi:hypothetical protein
MPDQDFVEEAVAGEGGLEARFAAGDFKGGAIDEVHIVAESVMDCHDCI